MSYIGKSFPNLDVKAIDYMGDTFALNILKEARAKNQKVLLFWYPKDFTYVCPTELHAFQEALEEFKKRNTLVIGASCDTAEVHFAWLNTAKDDGGIEGITYPLIADSTRNLASVLGILDSIPTQIANDGITTLLDGDHVSYRATYLIDEEGMVFHEGINHMPLGRNVQEYIRLVDAYSHFQHKGEVCPANWEEGDKALNTNNKSVAEYLSATIS
ncbi:MAG: peroxiredoxin [Bacteroidota bacterium]